jgi:hypothetical protein
MWRLHSTKLRCKFKYILRFFSCIGIWWVIVQDRQDLSL